MAAAANDATYSGCAEGGYSLSEEMAASLRVPRIDWPEGRVPLAVVKKCVNGGVDLGMVDAHDGTVSLEKLLEQLRRIHVPARLRKLAT